MPFLRAALLKKKVKPQIEQEEELIFEAPAAPAVPVIPEDFESVEDEYIFEDADSELEEEQAQQELTSIADLHKIIDERAAQAEKELSEGTQEQEQNIEQEKNEQFTAPEPEDEVIDEIIEENQEQNLTSENETEAEELEIQEAAQEPEAEEFESEKKSEDETSEEIETPQEQEPEIEEVEEVKIEEADAEEISISTEEFTEEILEAEAEIEAENFNENSLLDEVPALTTEVQEPEEQEQEQEQEQKTETELNPEENENENQIEIEENSGEAETVEEAEEIKEIEEIKEPEPEIISEPAPAEEPEEFKLKYDFTSGERYVDKVSTKTEFDKMLDELAAISKDLLSWQVEKFAKQYTGKFQDEGDKSEADAKKYEAFLGGYITNAAMTLYDNGYRDAAIKQLEQAKSILIARKRLEEETQEIKNRVEEEDAAVDLSDILGMFGDG